MYWRYVLFFFQSSLAETIDVDEELDEEFLEILGSFEAREDDWYDFFWSAVEETEQESTADEENE